MLVLTRRVGETLFIDLSDAVDPSTPVGELFIDGPVEVAVLDVNGSQVKVGVEAPEDVHVVREVILPGNDGHPVKRVQYATEVNHDKTNSSKEDDPETVFKRIQGAGPARIAALWMAGEIPRRARSERRNNAHFEYEQDARTTDTNDGSFVSGDMPRTSWMQDE